ncbi:MAG: rhomboid family intramembrane serine protease [Candidatus Sulfotelmatobacter sp.]
MANCIRCGRQLPGFTFGKKICQWCVQHEAAQRGEIVDDTPQRVMPMPWVRRSESSISITQVLVGMNAAVFMAMLVQIALGKAPEGASIMDFGSQVVLWGANVGPLTIQGEWWRLLTNIFVHGGLIHIAFNMWCLWNLGQLAESLYGGWTYTAIYLICGLGASLTSVWWHPFVPSVGASGAIFGLAGALLAAFKLGEFSVPRAALSGVMRSLVAFVGYNLLFSFLPGIDMTAHIGGLITGLIVGALIAVLAPRQTDAPKRALIFLIMLAAIVAGADGLAHLYNVPFRLHRIPFAHASNQMPSRQMRKGEKADWTANAVNGVTGPRLS